MPKDNGHTIFQPVSEKEFRSASVLRGDLSLYTCTYEEPSTVHPFRISSALLFLDDFLREPNIIMQVSGQSILSLQKRHYHLREAAAEEDGTKEGWCAGFSPSLFCVHVQLHGASCVIGKDRMQVFVFRPSFCPSSFLSGANFGCK